MTNIKGKITEFNYILNRPSHKLLSMRKKLTKKKFVFEVCKWKLFAKVNVGLICNIPEENAWRSHAFLRLSKTQSLRNKLAMFGRVYAAVVLNNKESYHNLKGMGSKRKIKENKKKFSTQDWLACWNKNIHSRRSVRVV